MFEIHVYHHIVDSRLAQRVDTLEAAITQLSSKGNAMSAELDRLTTEVQEISGEVDSAIILIGGLAQQIRDLQNEPAALAKLADDLDAKAHALGAAIVANSPTP